MTEKNTMTQVEAALAWAQMKNVQIQLVGGSWLDIPKPGQATIPKAGWVLGGNVFNGSMNAGPFRLKPEPTIRPLTIEEWRGKVGSVVALKKSGNTAVVIAVGSRFVFPAMFPSYQPEEMLARFTFADGSPCGVLEGDAE